MVVTTSRPGSASRPFDGLQLRVGRPDRHGAAVEREDAAAAGIGDQHRPVRRHGHVVQEGRARRRIARRHLAGRDVDLHQPVDVAHIELAAGDDGPFGASRPVTHFLSTSLPPMVARLM
jgi:hypothetical protein